LSKKRSSAIKYENLVPLNMCFRFTTQLRSGTVDKIGQYFYNTRMATLHSSCSEMERCAHAHVWKQRDI